MPQGTDELRGLEETEQVETVEIEEITDETADTENTEAPEKESVRETVARVLKESRDKPSDGSESPGEEKEQPVKPGDPKKPEKAQTKADPDIEPPARFRVEDKELFNRLPKGLKKAVNETIRNLEGMATRASQEYSQAAAKNKHLTTALEPFARKWGEKGFTLEQGMVNLAAAQERLTDPKTSLDAFIALGRDLGHISEDGEFIAAQNGQGQAAKNIDISSHPAFISLQEKLNALVGKEESQERQRFDTNVNSIVSEMETVRDEKDQAGRYRYPKLHDGAFLDRVKPLVSALLGTVPNLSYADALRNAYHQIEGTPQGTSFQSNQTRLSTPQSSIQQRAAAAAVSVRGRTAAAPSGVIDGEFPPEALRSPRETVAWALEKLRRGN